MDSLKAPKGWFDYSPIGKQIEGTRFIAFKVPLKKQFTEVEDSEICFTVSNILKKIPNLGLVIDLTNTDKYYNPKDFGVKHIKILVPGHTLPTNNLRLRFNDAVKNFMIENEKNDKLIGVHCTHGVNRTGFFICNQMISVLGIEASEAMKRFAEARGHKIERANYIEYLRNSAGKNLPINEDDARDDVQSYEKPEVYPTNKNRSHPYENRSLKREREERQSWRSSSYRHQDDYPARSIERTSRSADDNYMSWRVRDHSNNNEQSSESIRRTSRNADDNYLSWRVRDHSNNNEQSPDSRRVLRHYENDASERYRSKSYRNSRYTPISSSSENNSKD